MTPNELEQLYEEHAQALYAFLLNITRNEADTRDLLQELFCKIAAEPQLLKEARDRRSFLLRWAHNRAIDWMRRRQTRERASTRLALECDDLFLPGDTADEELFRRELNAALAKIPDEQRAVLHLKIWEGLTFEEIAQLLNISLNTAASRYRYGLDKLRAALRPIYDEVK